MTDWRRGCSVFAERAEEYDSWFTDSPVFASELAAVRELAVALDRPRLEIGVGPGRFARALAIEYGLDPAWPPLKIAARRGITPIQAIGEQLPLRTGSLGGLVLLFTLCFVGDASLVLRECHRVLCPDGTLLLGVIPAESAWGRELERKKADNHPFYRHARFRTLHHIQKLVGRCGFTVHRSLSTLRQPPGDLTTAETPRPGMDEDAGFCVLALTKHDRIQS